MLRGAGTNTLRERAISARRLMRELLAFRSSGTFKTFEGFVGRIPNQFLILLFSLCVIAAAWLNVLQRTNYEYADEVRRVHEENDRLALTFEEHVRRVVKSGDNALLYLKMQYEKHGQVTDSMKDFIQKAKRDPIINQIAVVNAKGKLLLSAVPSKKAFDTSHLVRFQEQAINTNPGLYIGKPLTYVSGMRAFFITRRLNKPDRSFDGFVSVGLDPRHLVNSFIAPGIGSDKTILLVGKDGIVRARRFNNQLEVGQSIAGNPMFKDVQHKQAGHYESVSSIDGLDRISSYRALLDYPLIVVVADLKTKALSTFQKRKSSYFLLTNLFTLLVAGFCILLIRAEVRMRRQNTRLTEELEERRKAEETIKYQAYHDPLTGLSNRALLMERLQYELAQARRRRNKLAIMFLDLDRFKIINDTLGHIAGDELLKEVSGRLKTCLRAEDTIARLGGDEFAVLLPEITENDDAVFVAKKILSCFEQPYTITNQEAHTGVSIGISLYPTDGHHEDTLLKNADIAMYFAKEKGGGAFQFYQSGINTRTIEHMILENSLRQTLERGELVVFYQPQIDLETRRIICVEALVRWQHPEKGLLDPYEFMPLAEETGFIILIDGWVLRTACAQTKVWQETGYPDISITVNLSARQLGQPGLLETVKEALREAELRPEHLELEISENIAMQNVTEIMPKLKKLTKLGIRLSIDDFGTGYTSLGHLKRLPIQRVKIDKSFIKGIDQNDDDKTIVDAVIAMAHKMKLKVVAEGVETKGQLLCLESLKCDEIQGYLLGMPLPADKFEELILSQMKLPF